MDALARRIGADARARLAAARVGVAGLGGLGSHIAVMLARSGWARCTSWTSTSWTSLTSTASTTSASTSAGRRPRRLPSSCGASSRASSWRSTACVDAGNAAALFAGERIVCEAFDDPACKADLVNALLTETPDTVVVAGSGMAGAGPADAVVTRRAGRRLYVCGDGATDVADAALFAPRVALCAAQQALVAVRLVLGLEEA